MSRGRHARRPGAPRVEVRRGRWDERQRAQAARLDAGEPGWVITYGLWSRKFFAFAAWEAPRALVVAAATVEALWDTMRRAEMDDLAHQARARRAT